MFYQVSPSQLDAWREQCASDSAQALPVLLDVREHWEHALANAVKDTRFAHVHIPMAEVPARLSELDPQRPIACLCHHGARSMSVAAYLAQQGFTQVANVVGGIDAWATEYAPGMARY